MISPKYQQVTDIHDPRLDPFRDLKKSNATRATENFIAEGRLVVERLLASDFEVISLLVSEARLQRIKDKIPPNVTTLLVSHELCSRLVGFNFHAGILACGRRKLRPQVDQESLPPDNVTLLACPQISLPDNLGSIVRLAAAFEIQGVICGPQSADPFSRRVVRVSMGNIFQMPIFEPPCFDDEIRRLAAVGNFEIVGATRNSAAIPLSQFAPSRRTVLMVGNEAEGLPPTWLTLCDREVTIEMSSEVDSLNVATAVGIILYDLAHRRPR